MKEILFETLLDTIKILPFLLATFFIMEFIEHKFDSKSKDKIKKSGNFGPFFGSLLGAVPQCGFSVMGTNLYATRLITIGTLVSIYLSTSDEMLPILISEGASLWIIIKIVLIKILIGMVSGFIIDFIFRKKSKTKDQDIKKFCLEEHCDCDHGILKSSIKHTFNIILFIFLINILISFSLYFFGEENMSKLFLKDNIFSPLVSSLIGLIPNCTASVAITQLYLQDVISFASCVSGLLTTSGVALAVLFKVNKSIKENLKIILIIYFIGALTGIIIELLEILV